MKKLKEEKNEKFENVMSIIVDIYFYFYFVTSINFSYAAAHTSLC